MAVALDTLGGIYKVQKNMSKLKKVQRYRLSQCSKSAFGPSSPDVAITPGNLAHTDSFSGRVDEAKSLMQRSVAICKQVYGPTYQKTKEAEKQLADLIASRRRPRSRRLLYCIVGMVKTKRRREQVSRRFSCDRDWATGALDVVEDVLTIEADGQRLLQPLFAPVRSYFWLLRRARTASRRASAEPRCAAGRARCQRESNRRAALSSH